MAQARRRRTGAFVLLMSLAVGCATDDADVRPEPSSTPEPRHVAPRSQASCDVIEAAVDGGIETLEQRSPVEALQAVPELSWTASAMRLPEMRELLDDRDGVTIFAPLDDAQPDDAGRADGADQPPPQALVHPGVAAGVEQLSADGPLEMADGGRLELAVEDDRAWVIRGEVRTEIVCADLVLDGAVLHVTDGIPYDADEEERDLDVDAERRDAPDPTTQPDDADDADSDDRSDGVDDGAGSADAGNRGTGASP
jgi:hypothetical protein